MDEFKGFRGASSTGSREGSASVLPSKTSVAWSRTPTVFDVDVEIVDEFLSSEFLDGSVTEMRPTSVPRDLG